MTNDELAQKILNDIKNINEKRGKVLEKLTHHDITSESNDQIQTVFNFLRDNDFSYILSSQNILFLNTIEKLIEPLSITVNTIVNSMSLTAINMKNFMNYVNQLNENIDKLKQKSNPDQESKSLTQNFEEMKNEEFQKNPYWIKVQEQMDALANATKPVNDLIKKSEETANLQKELNDIKESIAQLQSTEAQDNIHKILTKTLSLYDQAKNSSGLVNQEIQELKKAKEGHIAYNLSKELQHKADALKEEADKKIGTLSWKPLKLSGFYGSIIILLFVNLISWAIYFSCDLNIDFWQYMMVKLTINIPLIIYVAFALNEYTKAKKLYEEFDYKRILAQTLMNNYNQFKQDFTDNQDKLLDLIKAPLEKIFDNPVHSIYGDKSGDKNIGLDQLEKISSIIEKMKSK